MKIDFTPELAQLMNFAGDTATAIRMYSKYSGGTPMNGGQYRDPSMAPVDLMFLSDVIIQLQNIGEAIERGDPANIADTCHSVQRLFESYTTDNPSFNPQAKPTFDYWEGLVDLNIAVKVLKMIQDKAKMPTSRNELDLVGALRTMRKWGFTIIQDQPGMMQEKDDQMQRARTVAADLLGCSQGGNSSDIERVAKEILQTAEVGRQLPQFK